MKILLLIILILVGISIERYALGYVAKIWPTQGKWGINANPVNCPTCGTPAPTTRKPANRKQALWGGWTCAQCGTEFDKYGRAES